MKSTPLVSFLNVEINLRENSQRLLSIPELSIGKGNIVGIRGPSGVGKSSLLGLLSGVLDPQAFEYTGQIVACQENSCTSLLDLPKEDHFRFNRQFISYIPQEPTISLNPIRRIGTQIIEGLEGVKKETKARAIALLEKLKISDAERLYQSFPHQVSGGQLQRCLIAAALLRDTPLILADEPTSSLDTLNTQEVMALLKWMNQEFHKTILIVSHDQNFLSKVSNMVYVLENGQLTVDTTSGSATAEKEINDSYWVPQKTVFQIKDLTYVYRSRNRAKSDLKALDKVNFCIYEQEILGILGASGCGKSTLAKLMVGILSSQGGQIYANGQSFNQYNRKDRAKMSQLVFQNPYTSFNPKMKMGPAIQEVLRMYHRTNHVELMKNLLEQMDLSEALLERYPDELSGGQRQRFAILRSLAVSPAVLICDEITSNLDTETAEKVLLLLKRLRDEQQLSIVMIAHDIRMLASIADRLLVMSNGQIIERGMTSEIINNPKHQITRQLLQAAQE